MKGSHILNYQELPRLRDSVSYLYVEHAVIEKDDNAIVSISAEGRMPIPVSGVTCLLLGPGTNVTHSWHSLGQNQSIPNGRRRHCSLFRRQRTRLLHAAVWHAT